MNRTLNATLIAFVAVVSTAAAVPPALFTSWEDLTQESQDIVIARCTAAPDNRPAVAYGLLWADIEVLSVLKGNTKPGVARMLLSTRTTQQGERFLLFSTYQSNESDRGYHAPGEYMVVPLSRYFLTNDLTGKPLAEQIQIVLRRRLEDLNRDLVRAVEEKKRLERGLTK